MANCHYCNRAGGFFRSVHKECRKRWEEDRERVVKAIEKGEIVDGASYWLELTDPDRYRIQKSEQPIWGCGGVTRHLPKRIEKVETFLAVLEVTSTEWELEPRDTGSVLLTTKRVLFASGDRRSAIRLPLIHEFKSYGKFWSPGFKVRYQGKDGPVAFSTDDEDGRYLRDILKKLLEMRDHGELPWQKGVARPA